MKYVLLDIPVEGAPTPTVGVLAQLDDLDILEADVVGEHGMDAVDWLRDHGVHCRVIDT